MLKILPYLKATVERRASDIYFSPNAPAMLRVEGDMIALGHASLTSEFVRELALSILTPEQQVYLAEHLEIDLATQAGGLGRFRVNVFHQRNVLSMVMRHVRSDIPHLEELGMPAVVRDLAMQKRGLVMMVGATGSGKSTTLAAMINERNETSAGHIITVEDPIEFVHQNKRSIVNQREIGQDTHSYERALISALREAPDVIVIGEVRTRETMDACIQLANTGHLVISTLHANNAYQALQRIVNLYPNDQRDQLYMDLSLTLRAVISQRLVKKKDDRRCAAVEVMLNTPFIQELILSRKISEIGEAMSQSSDRGMQTFEDSLFKLYRQGTVDMDTAVANADSRANLEAKINFGA